MSKPKLEHSASEDFIEVESVSIKEKSEINHSMQKVKEVQTPGESQEDMLKMSANLMIQEKKS